MDKFYTPVILPQTDTISAPAATFTKIQAKTNGKVYAILPSAVQKDLTAIENITETLSTASPNATVNVEALTVTSGSTNTDLALVPKGTGAFMLSIPDGTAVGGNKRGVQAIDLQLDRNGAANRVASGLQSVCIGNSNTANNSYAIAIGLGNTCTGAYSIAFGGSNSATALGATAFGLNQSATASYSVCFGQFGTAALEGLVVMAHSGGSPVGQTQFSFMGLKRLTNGTTPVVATTNGSGASATNQLTLRNNSASRVRLTAVARDVVTFDSKEWSTEILIKRGANAAATSIVGTPTVTSTFADAGASAWTLAVSADTTNGALAVTVTGAGSNNIRWQVELMTNEVTA